MHKLTIGSVVEPEYRSKLVLFAKFMHGDADLDTTEEFSVDPENPSDINTMLKILRVYRQCGKEHQLPSDLLDFDEEIDSDDLVMNVFPWDQTQADIGMYENRAVLMAYSLRYFDSNGTEYDATLEEIL